MRKTFKWGVQVQRGKDLVTIDISDSRQEAELTSGVLDDHGKVVRVLCLIPK